ncbi:putative alfa-l-rhamnosidase protein [Phaeoacremonium minimum UCRPA7]|uniref:alpha-L-rhamnosidase n=1 Tax=Phaeoacremonium minimum (strain UCR-PA7) TaxID=1286976 RepID=R8B9C0_PHAM7|nr:putative alfa-l-rhamnosidase protein [Phaeoacremonium minimum UCRPA7]EON95893.1 putative alfa-l-rhamnosidase protein [Phaeoacremonium minimum UCRPA7]
MVAWVDRGIRRGPDRLWDSQLWQLGDWLDPTAPPDEPGNARTNGTLVADAYLVHVTSVLAEISRILGEEDDARRYALDFQQLKSTFQEKYIAPSGFLVGDSQTALSLALVYDLHATPEQVARAAERLVELVRFAKFRVSTGFAGTPIITHALTKSGHHQIAYRMLQEKNRPSWMYPISMGATTVWERWDSMLPDGSINPGEMTSFNHYALGSVINWLHECVAGVSPLEPGWKTFRVAPIPGGTVTWAEATYETPYGRLECRWSIRGDDQFELDLSVPANSSAQVILPHERTRIPESVGRFVGSGRHHFQSRWNKSTQWPPKPLLPPVGEWEEDTFV